MATLENSNAIAAQVAKFLQLERSRRRWRLIAGIAVILFLMSILALGSVQQNALVPQTPHIAQVVIDGVITDDFYQQKILQELQDNKKTKAVIVYVDSAGGTMVGGINLFQRLRALAAEKPVVTVMGTVAASAGYMVAIAGDYVFASPGTITGSVGVLMPLVDATELANKVGIKSDEVSSGSLKAVTSPLTKRGPVEKAYLHQTVLEMQKVFLDLVLSRRNLTPDVVTQISDGRIITGLSAKNLGLVDALGSRQDAKKWLVDTHNLQADIPVVDITTEEPEAFFQKLVGQVQGALFSSQKQHAIMARLF